MVRNTETPEKWEMHTAGPELWGKKTENFGKWDTKTEWPGICRETLKNVENEKGTL